MIYILIALLLLILDQLTKLWSRNVLAFSGSIPVIPDFFHLTYVENRGAAFGILSGKTTLFLAVTVLAIVLLVGYARSQRNNSRAGFLNILVTLIIAGAVGNLIDRIQNGLVIDFFDFRIWPVFNIADIAIVVGVGCIIYALLFKADLKR